jgi:hypothetical protein
MTYQSSLKAEKSNMRMMGNDFSLRKCLIRSPQLLSSPKRTTRISSRSFIAPLFPLLHHFGGFPFMILTFLVLFHILVLGILIEDNILMPFPSKISHSWFLFMKTCLSRMGYFIIVMVPFLSHESAEFGRRG